MRAAQEYQAFQDTCAALGAWWEETKFVGPSPVTLRRGVPKRSALAPKGGGKPDTDKSARTFQSGI